MKAIFHCDKNWGIGKKNTLMFRLPQDMAFFKNTTKGGVVVMGYNTMLSLGSDPKPLKNRVNIVLSTSCDESYKDKGFIIARNIEQLKKLLSAYNTEIVYIIGGAKLYQTLLPYCTDAIVTKVAIDGNADIFVENLDNNKNWEISEHSAVIVDNNYNIQFLIYKNKHTLAL